VFTAEDFTSEIIILTLQRVNILPQSKGSLPSVVQIISGIVCVPNGKRTEGKVKSNTGREDLTATEKAASLQDKHLQIKISHSPGLGLCKGMITPSYFIKLS
jgi:hypothetical protein